MNRYWYTGSLGEGVCGLVLSGKTSYRAQKQRCENPNHCSYPRVGGKGIRVEYELREFIGWWIVELMRGDFVQPTTGRKDHSKNYSFDNIQIEERADGAREANERTGYRGAREVIARCPTQNLVLRFSSPSSAARATAVPIEKLRAHLDGQIDSPHSHWIFTYGDQDDSQIKLTRRKLPRKD